MYSFRKSIEDIQKKLQETRDIYITNAKTLIVFWETKKEILDWVVPAPLQPVNPPLAISFVAEFGNTSAGEGYNESALAARVTYNNERGSYYLGMNVTDDRSAFAGREFCGFPKKIADIHLEKTENRVKGWADRLGTRCVHMEATLNGRMNTENALDVLDKAGMSLSTKSLNVTYLFKHFFNPERTGFDFPPTLIKQTSSINIRKAELGQVDIQLASSEHDPWGEIEIIRPLGAIYFEGDVTMHTGRSLMQVDGKDFLPYAFGKWDWHA